MDKQSPSELTKKNLLFQDNSSLIHYAAVSTPLFRKQLSSKSKAILSKGQMQDTSVGTALKLYFPRVEKSTS